MKYLPLYVEHNVNMCWKYYIENPDLFQDYPSTATNVTISIVANHPELDWHWVNISRYMFVNQRILETYGHLPWSYSWLSTNPFVTLELAEKFPDKPWQRIFIDYSKDEYSWEEYLELSENNSLVIEHVNFKDMKKIHPPIPEHTPHKWLISCNKTVTWEMVQENPEVEWDYMFLGKNSTIAFETILANLDKPWDFVWVSCNESITWKNVREHPEMSWDYMNLSSSVTMDKERRLYTLKRLQEWFSHSDLKMELMEKTWHPKNLQRLTDNGHELLDM